MNAGLVGLFLAGGALLIVGAELLVRGASRLAEAAGISPLVVGLTVVAMGTSSPELAVTLGSALNGQTDVALGNVVGSNIFNVLFILGLAALVTPLVVARQLVRLDVPVMVGVSFLALILAMDGTVGRTDGAVLTLGLVLYTGFLIVMSRRETSGGAGAPEPGLHEPAPSPADHPDAGAAPAGAPRPSWLRDLALVAGGLVLLVFGSRWLVNAAVATAEALGVSPLVIGLTIVAAGTSLPEVATSVLASIRGQRDIAVGNVVGSNIFNILGVLGLGSLVAPDGVPVSAGALTFDLPVMIAVAVATLPIFFTGFTIARWEGAVFLGYYLAYTLYLVLDATEHAVLNEFRQAMLGFVLPLTVLTLGVVTVRALRGRAGGGA